MGLRVVRGRIPTKKGKGWKKLTFKGKPQYTITKNGRRVMVRGRRIGFFDSMTEARRVMSKIKNKR